MTSPRAGGRILILKWPWLELILSSAKTMEIRGVAFRKGRYYLGFKKNIYGWVCFGDAIRIANVEQWNELRHRHRVPSPQLPYKKTFGSPILSVQSLSPIPFKHPRGAIAIVRYH